MEVNWHSFDELRNKSYVNTVSGKQWMKVDGYWILFTNFKRWTKFCGRLIEQNGPRETKFLQ